MTRLKPKSRSRSSKGKSGTSDNERKSQSSTDSRGFSSIIYCSDQIENRYGKGKIIEDKTTFLVPANWKLNDEDLNFLIKVISKNVAISLDVIDHDHKNSGEKDLYFPMFDILRIPLCLSKLRDDEVEVELGSVDDSVYLDHEFWIRQEEHETKEDLPLGPVEFIIKRQQKIIFIVEMKTTFTGFGKGGFWQLLSQLATVRSRNPDMVEVAGAFSDLKTWVFVKMTRGEDNKLHYSVSKAFRCFSQINSKGPLAWEIQCKEVLEYILFIFASDKERGVDAAVSLFENTYPQYEEDLIKKITTPWEEAKEEAKCNAPKEVLEEAKRIEAEAVRRAAAAVRRAKREVAKTKAQAKRNTEKMFLENQRLKRQLAQLATKSVPEEVPANKKLKKYHKVKKN